MEEYNFCDELESIYNDGIFKKELIEYRVNGFISSMDLDVSNAQTNHIGIIDLDSLSFLNNKGKKNFLPKCNIVEKNSKNNDFIVRVYNSNTKNTGWIRVDGLKDNVAFDLNIFRVRKLSKTDVKEVPFTSNIEVHLDNLMYCLNIRQDGLKTIYTFHKTITNPEMYDEFSFQAHRNDCESIFKIINIFKEKPEYVYDTYKKVLLEKEIAFSNKDLDKIDEDNDILLDSRGRMLQKVLNTEK